MSYLRALLKILAVVFLLLAGSIAFYSYFYGEDIKNYLLKEINKQLLVQTDVKEVDYSLWQNFPNLSLILKEVRTHQNNQTIIAAEEVRIKFSLADILDKNFAMHAVSISNADLYLLEAKDGRFFPRIWKMRATESDEEELTFELDLQKITLSKVGLHYRENDATSEFDLTINSAWAKGNFGTEQFNLAWNSEVTDFSYKRDGEFIMEGESFSLESICQIIQKESRLQINDLQLNWKGIDLQGKGKFDYKDQVSIDISFAKDKGNIQGLYPLLFNENRLQLDSLNPNGNIAIDGRLVGELSPSFQPKFRLNYQIEDGELSGVTRKWEVKQLFVKGSYESANLGLSNVGLFKIDTVTATLNGMNFHGSSYWLVGNHSTLYLNGVLNGNLTQLNDFLSEDTRFSQGTFYAEAELVLPFNELGKMDLSTWKKTDNSIYFKIDEGEIELADNHTVQNLTAEAALGSNDLYTQKLHFNYDQFNIDYQGKFLNLISFLNDSNEVLMVDGNLISPFLKLEDLFALSNQEESGSSSRKIQLYLNCNVAEMTYKSLQMKEVSFYLRSNGANTTLERIQLNSLGGKAKGNLAIHFSENGSRLESEAEFEGLDIHELFDGLENFGQEMITADNLYGKASGFMNMKIEFDDKGEIDSKSLVLNGFIDIQEGKLLNYEPLYELSKYIELDELKEIKFKRLQNQIRIANEEIFIPRFTIQSSAINLEMEGTHTFNNDVDYKISLLLSQILGKKAKKPKDTEFGYVEDDGLGRSQLFLRMTGNISDPDIRYDQQQLGKHWKKEAQEEKREIKSILKKEFGLFKGDSTIKDPSSTKKEGPLFEIEWDEDTKKEPFNVVEGKQEEEKKSKKKGKFGKFIDKIAKPNEEEYVTPQE